MNNNKAIIHIPPRKREQYFEVIENLSNQFGCNTKIVKLDLDDSHYVLYSNAESMQSIEDFFAALQNFVTPYNFKTAVSPDGKACFLVEVNNPYQFTDMILNYLAKIRHLDSYADKIGIWSDDALAKNSGLETFETQLINGSLPEDVTQAVKFLAELIANWEISSSQYSFDCTLPTPNEKRDFDYQGNYPDDDYATDDSNDDADDDYSEDDYSSDDDSLN